MKKTNTKNRTTVELIASLLLIFLVHSILSIAMFQGLPSLRNCLAFYTERTNILSWAMLASEIITATLLFISRTRTLGFICSIGLALVAGFVMLRFPSYPHDFGGLLNHSTEMQKWMLIGLIITLSIFGILISFLAKPKNDTIPKRDHAVFT